jgi:hypothetical protein
MVQVAVLVWAVGVRNNKMQKVNMRSSGNCIFHEYWEQSPTEAIVALLHIT